MTTASRQVEFGEVHLPEAEDPFREIKAKTAAWPINEATLLFDARHAVYRAIHTRDGLTSPTGEDTRGLHGFLEIVATCCAIFRTSRIVLFWDGGVENKRKVHPGYKLRQDAAKTDDEIAQALQTKAAMEVAIQGVKRLGLPEVYHNQFEADDLIGTAIANLVDAPCPVCKGGAEFAILSTNPPRRRECGTCGDKARVAGRVVIVSDDKDFYQLVGPNVSIWRGVSKKLVGPAEFASQFPFTPDKYVDWKALVGESATGDNIPGVPGFGEKKASTYIGSHGSLMAAIDYARDRITKPKPYAVDVALANNVEAANLSFTLSRICRSQPDLAAWSGGTAASIAARSIAEALKNCQRRISFANASRVLRGTYGFAAETCETVLRPMGFV